MDIFIVTGKGYGKTTLSAFDSALKDAGIENYNLLYLSSIIPKESKVICTRKYKTPKGEYGHRLYVVKAEIRGDESGKAIAAGLGWYQQKNGKGVFVEHTDKAETIETAEEDVEVKINRSLKDLCRNRRFKFVAKNAKMVIVSTKIEDQPACVIAAAVYRSEGWN